MWRWESGGYPTRFMAKVVAWYSRSREVELHRQDAAARAAEKKK